MLDLIFQTNHYPQSLMVSVHWKERIEKMGPSGSGLLLLIEHKKNFPEYMYSYMNFPKQKFTSITTLTTKQKLTSITTLTTTLTKQTNKHNSIPYFLLS